MWTRTVGVSRPSVDYGFSGVFFPLSKSIYDFEPFLFFNCDCHKCYISYDFDSFKNFFWHHDQHATASWSTLISGIKQVPSSFIIKLYNIQVICIWTNFQSAITLRLEQVVNFCEWFCHKSMHKRNLVYVEVLGLKLYMWASLKIGLKELTCDLNRLKRVNSWP